MTAKMAVVTSLVLMTLAPASIGHLRFIQLTTPLSVSAEKSHPPFLAFHEAERLHLRDPWEMAEQKETRLLTTQAPTTTTASLRMTLAQETILQLEPMTLAQQKTISEPRAVATTEERAWVQELPRLEQLRVSQAELKHGSLTSPRASEESSLTWREHAAQVLKQAQKDLQTPPKSSPIIVGSGTDASGNIITPERSFAQVQVNPTAAAESAFQIEGEFELLDLALLNDTQIEIRRRDEGVYEEKGQVQPLAATYSIRVYDRSGEVVLRLKDRDNRILGESSFRLATLDRTDGNLGQIRGPKLVIRPKTDYAGRVLPTYAMSHSPTKMKTIAGISGEALSGAADLHVGRNGDYELNNIRKGSFSLLAMQAKDHARTAVLAAAGSRSDIPLFPETMIRSLKEIVSEQRRQNLNDPMASVVWGEARVDGKPVSGVRVEVESAQDFEAVYFNEWMIPDASLRVTSANGLYAFIGVPEGFHAILGHRGDQIFSHQNVVVQKSVVSVGNLESTHQAVQARLRVFDAFTGEAQGARLTHQGVSEPIEVDSRGLAFVQLPSKHRLSLTQAHPESPYASARYYSDDERGYVHYPLVREDWLRSLKSYLKINENPNSSTVIGFVPHEEFTADALDSQHQVQVVYFDSSGRPTETGVAGGGFLIFGLSEGVREILVTSGRTGEISSQVIASDVSALSVLRFQED